MKLAGAIMVASHGFLVDSCFEKEGSVRLSRSQYNKNPPNQATPRRHERTNNQRMRFLESA